MKGKPQLLSPENYIRTRARALPLGECFINDDWRETGFAMIIVTREHINGNVTHVSFLIDLYCLGVKDSFWKFNEHPVDFKDFMNDQFSKKECGLNLRKTNYPLVHNIIYGAIEFAGEFGFKPHKSFELTRHILEEDDERVKLIDIEFGYNGKPLYILWPSEMSESQRVLSHLEKKVGKGNFYFIAEADADEFFNREEENEVEGKGEGIDYQDPAIKKALIGELLATAETLHKLFSGKPGKMAEVLAKAEIILSNYMITREEEEKAAKHIKNLFDFMVSEENLSDEMIFGDAQFTGNRAMIRQEAEKLHRMVLEGQVVNGKARSERLANQYPNLPIFWYIHLRFLEFKTVSSKLKSNCKSLVVKFPGYLPFRYLYLKTCFIDRDPEIPLMVPDHLHLKKYYSGRSVFSIEEAKIYVQLLIIYYGIKGEALHLLMMLINFESKFPGVLFETEIRSGRIMILPRVLEWCETQR